MTAGTLLVESWPISRPKPYPSNARKLSKRAVSTVAASLKEYGWRQPIVVDDADVIIVGHTRLKAALSLGLEIVPVHVARDLSPAQVAGYRLMDNRSADESEWDAELLSPELLKLHEGGYDLALTGFSQDELAEFTKAAGLGANQADEDAIPEPLPDAVSVVGDLWVCGPHRLLCGDATSDEATARLFGGVKPDLAFSDPPYGVSIVKGRKVGGGGVTKFGKVGGGKMVESSTYAVIKNDHNTDAARGFYECAQRAGVVDFILWGGNYFTDFLPPSACWLIWDKQNTGNFADVEMAWSTYQKGAPRDDVEMVWTSYSKGAKLYPAAVRLYPYLWNGLARQGDRKSELVSRVHPTQKPVGLFERIFADFKFSSCYDGFLGSGSTLIACEKAGRACFGMELSRDYVDVAVQRWQNFSGLKATLEGDGRTFEEMKAARLQQ